MLLRSFFAAFAFMMLAGTAVMAQSPANGKIYELRSYVATPGRQADVLKLMNDSGLAMMNKYNITLVGAWTNVDPADERVFTLLSYKDKAAADAANTALRNDPEWNETVKKTEIDGKKAVASFERIFLTTNDYSPNLEVKEVGNRVFELRTYVASKGNLPALNARFKNHTLGLFTKHGMTNILYCSVLNGEKLTAAKLLEAVSPIGKGTAQIDADLPAAGNSLVYFITHASPEAAKVSFGKFGADEEWQKAYKASEFAAGGSLTAKDGVKSLFLKPTSFSPLK